jgi:predicted O-methyltransferase YrrM
LEIGTAAGGTLCEMLGSFFPDHAPPFAVVDNMEYFPNQFEIICANLRSHGFNPDAIDFRISNSDTAFSKSSALNEKFDFILIDGSHKIRYVTQDLRWTRLLNPGGIACFHDYSSRCPGVIFAVDRFLRRWPNYEKVTLADSLLVIEKKAPSTIPEITSLDILWSNILSVIFQLYSSIKKRF